MSDKLVVKESPYDPPDLVGSWTGEWNEIYTSEGEFVMMSLDVFFPQAFRPGTCWVRSFHRRTRDECIEAFGHWLDTVLECDTIR